MAECRFEPDRVFGVAPPMSGDGAAVIVDEGEQVGLAAGDDGAVEGVTGPTVVAGRCFEPAERRRRGAIRTRVQAVPREQALHGPLRDLDLFGGSDDGCDLRGGPARDLPLQLHGEVGDGGRGARRDLAGRVDEAVEAARPPALDPPVQRRTPDPGPGPVGPDVLTGGELTDQLTAFAVRE